MIRTIYIDKGAVAVHFPDWDGKLTMTVRHVESGIKTEISKHLSRRDCEEIGSILLKAVERWPETLDEAQTTLDCFPGDEGVICTSGRRDEA